MSKASVNKGDVVIVTMPKTKEKLIGVITKSTTKDLVVDVDSGEASIRTYGAVANKIEPIQLERGLAIEKTTGQTLSKELQAVFDEVNGNLPPIKRGQIVAYTYEGEDCTGRVVKGGAKPLVSMKNGDRLGSPARTFTPTEAPVIDPELADWDVSSFVEHGMGRDFMRWTATVTYKGKAVFKAICDGDGGPLRYEASSRANNKLIDQWQDALNKYIKDKGGDTMMGDELWPEYQYELAPTGLTFIEYIKNPI